MAVAVGKRLVDCQRFVMDLGESFGCVNSSSSVIAAVGGRDAGRMPSPLGGDVSPKHHKALRELREPLLHEAMDGLGSNRAVTPALASLDTGQ